MRASIGCNWKGSLVTVRVIACNRLAAALVGEVMAATGEEERPHLGLGLPAHVSAEDRGLTRPCTGPALAKKFDWQHEGEGHGLPHSI